VTAALHRLVAASAVMPVLVASVFLVLIHAQQVARGCLARSQSLPQARLTMSFQVG
jgi:hypothetical protein